MATETRRTTLEMATTGSKPRVGQLVPAFAAIAFSIAWFGAVRWALMHEGMGRADASLAQAERVLALHRQSVSAALQTQSRILASDARFRSTLSTPGIDEATVTDMLAELQRLAQIEVLAVLTPQGRVLAAVGAPGLRGLDLSTSAVVSSARESPTGAGGAWVLGDRLLEVGVMPIRIQGDILAYVVTGASVDREVLARVSEASGAGLALVMNGAAGQVVARNPQETAAFEAVARAGGAPGRSVLDAGGGRVAVLVAPEDRVFPPSSVVAAAHLTPVPTLIESLLWAQLAAGFATAGVVVFRAYRRGQSASSKRASSAR